MFALGTGQIIVHDLFDAGFTNYIRQFDGIVILLFFVVFISRNGTGITDDMCKILAVYIFTDRSFLDVYAGQFIAVFLDIGNRLITDIAGYGRSNIFLIRILSDIVTHDTDLIAHFSIIFVGNVVAFLSHQIVHDLIRCGFRFIKSQFVIVFQIINACMSKNIRTETL